VRGRGIEITQERGAGNGRVKFFAALVMINPLPEAAHIISLEQVLQGS
jgi:hypothetical protein